MEKTRVEILVPKEMASFVVINDSDTELKRNALLLYPHILDNSISHGKAAELLGINKIDLIVLYGKMGLSYLDEDMDEIEADLQAIRKVRGIAVWL